ncbi:hypothetical protein QM027_10060 [Campylobacter concisus]
MKIAIIGANGKSGANFSKRSAKTRLRSSQRSLETKSIKTKA